ncbi:MAG: alpha-N-arabinofuranosidase [Clostridia bacterium]|nr:alpha-N-arabinofuranosidase [Clostridia bacterium]
MATITIDASRPGAKINKNLYGNFSEHLGRCIYGGLFVGKDSPIPNVNGMRTDVVEALKKLNLPVLRWPGGCFADEYHWRDGIGPQEGRKRMVNTNWGGVVEDNSFGTHEFLELCDQIGCEPYINANVGSGSVQEMAEWVEYLNSDGDSTIAQQRWANGRKEPFGVKFWGVGNENWGCGGNMRPEYYADVYRRYQTYCRNYGDNKLYRIACGPSGDDWNWTEVLMKNAAAHLDAITLHQYTVPGDWTDKGSATDFSKEMYLTTLEKAADIERMIKGHLAIMDKYDKEHRVGLIVDEWGCWHNVEPGTNPGFLYQQNTMRDAMVAAIHLDIFNRHADRIPMANIAQMVNVLQAVILTDGAEMLLTPTYHVFDMYRPHMEAQLLDCMVASDMLTGSLKKVTASASIKDGAVTLTCSNLSDVDEEEVLIQVNGLKPTDVTISLLAGECHAMNTFENKENVTIKPCTDFTVTDAGISLKLPACSVAAITVRG